MNTRRVLPLLALLVLAACRAGAEEQATPALPAGFETVHLGMSVSELRAAHPSIRHDDFPYSTLYFERLPADHPSRFSDVGYMFDDKSGRLVQITFSWTGAKPELERRCGAFVASLESRLGAPAARRVGVIRRHYITNATHEFPVMEWSRDDAVVTARCVAISDAPKVRNFYDLTIATAAFAATRPAGELRASDAAEQERLFAPLLSRRADAPEFR